MPARFGVFVFFVAVALTALGLPRAAQAHCDSVDGPVVQAAARALDTGDVNLVLLWVRAEDEQAVREAFDHVRAVRTLSPEAAALADRYFFETVVRLHRAGEGAPFTGLAPSGQDFGPAVRAADLAVETGDAAPVQALLSSALQVELEAHFHALQEARGFASDDLAAGRRFVQRYVAWVHFVEGLHQAMTNGAAEAHAEPDASGDTAHAH